MILQRLISTYILKTISCVFLFLCCNTAIAQNTKVQNVIEKDSIPFFYGLYLSVDLVGVGQTLLSDYGQYEVALRANLKDRYFPIVELGYAKGNTQNAETTISFNTKAPYARVGLDFNVMKNKHDIYKIYVGARYGFSKFKYNIFAPNVLDPVWGGDVEYNSNGVNGLWHWAEFVFGLDAKIIGPLRAGWNIRYKRRISYSVGDIGVPYYAPGFGRSDASTFGGSFYLSLELFHKQKQKKKVLPIKL